MHIIWFKNCSYGNKALVGGKNASLGELFRLSKQLNFNIANGFAITTDFYEEFIKENVIEKSIQYLIKTVDTNNIEELNLVSETIKFLFSKSLFNEKQINTLKSNYNSLKRYYNNKIEVAVRSSAVCEDLPNASFAGQQDTYLNVDCFDDLLVAVKNCFASLFNSRAISYRKTNKIKFNDVKISVGVQKMVRSDIGSAGVCFSIDPETGYNKSVLINSAFGLGELVVSGGVKPDEFIVDKRVLNYDNSDPILSKSIGEKLTKIVYSQNGVKEVETTKYEKKRLSLNDEQIIQLSKWVYNLEKEYSKMFKKTIGVDVEWALDGNDNKIYIIQTRPETVHSNKKQLEKHKLLERSNVLVSGVAVGEKISAGKINILNNISEFKKFKKNDILVTSMTTPDWEPIMKISGGIITDKGGRTCHAAIVARELGINAIVGTSNASKILNNDKEVTLCCSEGEKGIVYDRKLNFEIQKIDVDFNKKLPIKLMLNVGSPEMAFSASQLPNQGVGLARLEFIINNYIKIHPLALLDYPNIRTDIKEKISNIIGVEQDGRCYFIDKLARGISKIASAFYPNNVIVRLSDFKSNEYKNLIGGELYEPKEENPMIGWRGASRYYSNEYSRAFALECLAIKYVREENENGQCCCYDSFL